MLALGACATAPPDVPTAGQLEILIPGPEVDTAGLAGAWSIGGLGSDAGSPKLTRTQRQGLPAIRVTAGDRRLTAVRQTRSPLLATPFLSWSWHLSATAADLHPVRLVAGFRASGEPPATGSGPLPGHQRLLTFAFGASALQRGTLARLPGPEDGGVYVARGGRENADAWWVETVDLEGLYRRLWPADDPAWVEVVFIGVTAEPAAGGESADLSGILLTR